MTSDELATLQTFLRENAPGSPITTWPTKSPAGGITLSWYGRAGGIVCSLSVCPAVALTCVSWEVIKTRNHRRVAGTLRLLGEVAAFAIETEECMRELRGPDLPLVVTEAKR